MAELYPEIEPYAHGWLDVDHGNRIYWEVCGNPQGKPALVVHGGPGSGCSLRLRRLFDPHVYRVILFDQRNCGRSTPHASQPGIDLTHNTTHHSIYDMDALRQHLNIEQWLVWGGSWGSTLSLAYAEQFPHQVSEMILFGITTGRHSEMDWLFRGGAAVLFPQEWERLVEFLSPSEREGDIVAAYYRRLMDPHPQVCQQAADSWCLWESATPDWPPAPGLSGRFAEPEYALAFARLVTDYISHDCWLEDGALLRDIGMLADIPAILVNGRFDFQAPIANAWALHRAWPSAELVIVDEAGHGSGMFPALVDATDRFARQQRTGTSIRA
jgi:proline iminopeptidase